MFNKSQQQEEPADFKKKRDTEADKLRKNNRDEIFSKRRNILTGADTTPSNTFEVENKKDRLLIVDERYRAEIEQYPPFYLGFCVPSIQWTTSLISSPTLLMATS